MPKEITHWLIAEQAAALLEGSPLGKEVAAYPQCLRLGAVFPDILFFISGRGSAARFRRMADYLHGSDGEDTYALLRGLLSFPVEDAYAGPLASFWVGIATHIRADMRFHPLVYFLTGPYHHPDPAVRRQAVQQHRRFETVMDMYFLAKGNRASTKYSLQTILDGLEVPLPYLLQKAALSISSSGNEAAEMENALRQGLKTFVTIQALCCRRRIGRVLYASENILPGIVREVTALFHAPQLESKFPRLRKEIAYQHPVTGEKRFTTIDDLFGQSIRDCADFCKKMELAVIKREPGMIQERGPSLSFGLPGITKAAARFFAISPHK